MIAENRDDKKQYHYNNKYVWIFFITITKIFDARTCRGAVTIKKANNTFYKKGECNHKFQYSKYYNQLFK